MTRGHLYFQKLPLGFDDEESMMEYLGRWSLSDNEQTLKEITADIEILQYRKQLVERVVERQRKKAKRKGGDSPVK